MGSLDPYSKQAKKRPILLSVTNPVSDLGRTNFRILVPTTSKFQPIRTKSLTDLGCAVVPEEMNRNEPGVCIAVPAAPRGERRG